MRYLIILAFILGCDGERELKLVVTEPEKPEIESVELISFLDGPNVIDQAGIKMIKPTKVILPVKVKPPVPEVKKVPKVKKKVVKKKTVKKKKLKPTPIPKLNRKFNKTARIKDGYKEVRYYGRGKCRGTVYEKDFKNSYFYIFVDCKNNYTTQRVGK